MKTFNIRKSIMVDKKLDDALVDYSNDTNRSLSCAARNLLEEGLEKRNYMQEDIK